jgi:dolichyl-diphosphooligosaccharide--protein glycosyltransferase
VAHSLLYTTVYFKQTSLYQTIAEAHSSDFSQIAFSIGPVPFLLAIVGWVVVLSTQRKYGARATLFALIWGAVALYMAHAALRFIINAVPVFAVFAAFYTIWIIDWLDFGTLRKSFGANRGNFWMGVRKGLRPMQVVITLLLVILLVIPNVILAADAAIPPEDKQRTVDSTNNNFVKSFINQELGAYGQGFLPPYWLDGLTWLDTYDQNISNYADRPAFLSWWDYGHWAIAVGNHPTVADNFQNGYQFAANFILAQNETHAVQLLSARTLPLVEQEKGRDAAVGLLTQAGVPAANASADYGALLQWQFVPDLTLDRAVALERLVTDATKDAAHPDGVRIRYFAADVRMLPYDDPKTPTVEQSSIFYAPVVLADQNPDDYVPTMIKLSTATNGGSTFVNQTVFNNLAKNPVTPVQAAGEKLQFTQEYYNSMFYRAYVGTPPQPTNGFPTDGDVEIQALNDPHPAFEMSHFRLVYANEQLRIIEYYPGATVSGNVSEEGTAVAGADVTAFDDAGKIMLDTFPEQFRAQVTSEDFDVPHDTTTTDASGHYSLTVPFAMQGGNVTLVVSKDGVEVAREHLAITRADAEAGTAFTQDVRFSKGSVNGTLYADNDGDGTFNATNDTPLSGVNVTIGGVTGVSGPKGAFNITGVPVGTQNVTVESTRYDVSPTSATVSVKPGQATSQDIGLELKQAHVSGELFADANGNGAPDPGEQASQQTIRFDADANVTGNTARSTTAFTDNNGNYTLTLAPGTYVVSATYTAPDGVTTYALKTTLTFQVGETAVKNLAMAKTTAGGSTLTTGTGATNSTNSTP